MIVIMGIPDKVHPNWRKSPWIQSGSGMSGKLTVLGSGQGGVPEGYSLHGLGFLGLVGMSVVVRKALHPKP